MPVYGLGTWKMGGSKTYDPDNNDQADIQAIKKAIENGIVHIDTAENYANGYTETLVGKAIKGYDRSKLFLVSKVAPQHLQYEDVITALKASLKRLQTDYLNLYLIHAPNPEIPLKETMRAMDTLLEEGLIKNIGVCNFNIEEFKEAQSYTKNKIVINQLHLNLKYREAERRGLLKYCQTHDVMFVAWRPLQKGMLLQQAGNLVDQLAKKYHKTPAQIALNWLISQENVVTISKTQTEEHLKENLGAVDWQMDKEDIERLDKEYPNQEDISDAVPLH